MASDLLSIATSGTRAARAAIDLTAQNIANADTRGYVRRTLERSELAPATGPGQSGGALSGVRIAGVSRQADAARQADLRRTTADAERSAAYLQGIEGIENAIDDAKPFDRVVAFEASLRRLALDPASLELQGAAIGEAQTMATSFNLAAAGLAAIEDTAHLAVESGSEAVNSAAAALARTNAALGRTPPASNERAALLDQRDALLQDLAERVGAAATIDGDGRASVRIGGPGGPLLVDGTNAAQLAVTSDGQGAMGFAIGNEPVSVQSGALGGHIAALRTIVETRADLDAAANWIARLVNDAQTNGVTASGAPGQNLFAGSGAGDMTIVSGTGARFSVTTAGGARSNLDDLVTALEQVGAAQGVSDLAMRISLRVADQRTTHDALETIATGARTLVNWQSGVSLDAEAADLVRFQQAFQASGRVMQVATTLFDTLLGVGR